jgi:hypothetical protein
VGNHVKSIDVVNPEIYETNTIRLPSLAYHRYSNRSDDICIRRTQGGANFIGHSLSITTTDAGRYSNYIAASYARMPCCLAYFSSGGMPMAGNAYIRL